MKLTVAGLSDEEAAGSAEPGDGSEKGGRAPEGGRSSAQSQAAAAAAAVHYQGAGAQVDSSTTGEYVDCRRRYTQGLGRVG